MPSVLWHCCVGCIKASSLYNIECWYVGGDCVAHWPSVLGSGLLGPVFQASCLHTCASVSKQYNLVPMGDDVRWLGRQPWAWRKSNGSLPPDLWLRSPASRLPRTRISSRTYARFQYGTTFTFMLVVVIRVQRVSEFRLSWSLSSPAAAKFVLVPAHPDSP